MDPLAGYWNLVTGYYFLLTPDRWQLFQHFDAVRRAGRFCKATSDITPDITPDNDQQASGAVVDEIGKWPLAKCFRRKHVYRFNKGRLRAEVGADRHHALDKSLPAVLIPLAGIWLLAAGHFF